MSANSNRVIIIIINAIIKNNRPPTWSDDKSGRETRILEVMALLLVPVCQGMYKLRGGGKLGYITCTILRCSRVWYDWNVNNVPMSCLSPYAWWDTEMAGSVVLYHCWWRSKNDHTNLYQYSIAETYTWSFSELFSSQCWNNIKTNSAIEFRPPTRRKNTSACHCSNSTYVSITYMYWFLSSLRSTSGWYC